ncbi:hypothetical protein CEUSTIGMA_g1886.t1 [Chlamydomonas eustigma]|uniref:E3 UFM1-protein ligase 1 homolog n=1 Tax=Chlamydomonas eustigma TaxID=1157962 RepID=A0A250WUD8_9CHLO|nr:hypothetical protein CEUSTIGMA_g1886.t1 [Chlamydomonas eustigma]|eukprot:GAX74437.1 hypothetical protein CEUSTIGMA_g1886.t1 [Chlamydomonas eustigma]
MELSIEQLLSALQTTQKAKSTIRLSERNIVELVIKLKQLGILGDDLLHTMNGREYVTTARLRKEVEIALSRSGGRLPLVELPTMIGVDLVHCERQAKHLVEESSGGIMEAQGELLTQQYFDSLAAEVDEMLQEAGVVTMADLALQYNLGAELLAAAVGRRVGSAIRGKLEGGLIYTPAYIRSIKSRLRGALRGCTSPQALPALVKLLGLEGPLLSGPVLHGLVLELVSEGSIKGMLKGGAGSWAPAVHAEVQQGAVKAFYHQNGWIGYETVRKLGIPNDRAFLAASFPDGLPLETAFVSLNLLSQVEAACEDVSNSGQWTDVMTLLPPDLSGHDVEALMSRLPAGIIVQDPKSVKMEVGAVMKALSAQLTGRGALPPAEPLEISSGSKEGSGRKVLLLAGSCLVPSDLVANLMAVAVSEARVAADRAVKEKGKKHSGSKLDPLDSASTSADVPSTTRSSDPAGKQLSSGMRGGGKAEEHDDDNWGTGPTAGKKGKKVGNSGNKGGKGGKGGTTSNSAAAVSSAAQALESVKANAGVSVSRLVELVLKAYPDMEGAGSADRDAETLSLSEAALGQGGALPAVLAALLQPSCVEAYKSGLEAALTAGAEAQRARREVLGDQMAAALSRLSLYCRGAQALEEDSQEGAEVTSSTTSTHSAVLRHIGKTVGVECVDLMYKWVRETYSPGDDAGEEQEEAQQRLDGAAAAAAGGSSSQLLPPLSAVQKQHILRAAPADVAAALIAAVEAVASSSDTRSMVSGVEKAAADAGLRLPTSIFTVLSTAGSGKKQHVDKKAVEAAKMEAASSVEAVRERLVSSLAAESDSASVLALAVPLMFIRATGQAVMLPGKAMAGVLKWLRGKLPDEELDLIEKFHADVVEKLKGGLVPDDMVQVTYKIKKLAGMQLISSSEMKDSS